MRPFRKKPKQTEKKLRVPRVYAFIDSQNLNMGTQKAGFKLDWRKFMQYLREEHHVTEAFLFIGYMQEYETMYESMHDLGYRIVLKPTVDVSQFDHPDDSEKKTTDEPKVAAPTKGNVDADLVLHTMKEFSNYDKAIIVTGDGDFHGLVEYLEQQQKLFHILTPNWQYSSLLKQFDKYIIRLDTLRKELQYYQYKKKK